MCKRPKSEIQASPLSADFVCKIRASTLIHGREFQGYATPPITSKRWQPVLCDKGVANLNRQGEGSLNPFLSAMNASCAAGRTPADLEGARQSTLTESSNWMELSSAAL